MPTQTKSSGSSNPFASGGTTNNIIPKSNGAGQLADSSITDNGTNVQSTESIISTNAGTAALPAIGVGATNLGFFKSGNYIGVGIGSGVWAAFTNSAPGGVQTWNGAGFSFSSTAAADGVADTFIMRPAAANVRLGNVNSATPIANTLQIGEASRGGTDTNVAGANGTIGPGIGTGAGVGNKLAIVRNIMGASGTTAQTRADAVAIGQSKTLSNTSATAQTIATITLGSNAGGGCAGTFTLVATDGTNFDSETQSFNVSFVNKAGAVTVGSVVATASTAANNSGSATLGITAVANGNNIDIKVTPVFGTIVPTTVTLYPVISHSTNTVTFV